MKLNLFYTFIILSTLGFLYRRFMDKFNYMSMKKDNKYLKEFLENNYGGEFNNGKPIAWLYMPFEKNAMNWSSFYSRNTKNINNTLVKEVLHKNTSTLRGHFNVLLIDNNSFKHLLDDNVVDLETIGDPLREKIINLYIIKLIRNYGGIHIPNHFAIQTPQELFDLLQQTSKETIIAFKKPFNDTLVYDTAFIGSAFNNNKAIEELEHLQTSLISNDVVDESNFKATSILHLMENKIIGYDIKRSGVFDADDELLTVEDFMSQTKPIQLNNGTFMVYLPIEQLSKRTHYNWITYVASSYSNQISRFL